MDISNRLFLFLLLIFLLFLIFYFFPIRSVLKQDEEKFFSKNMPSNSLLFFHRLRDILESLPRIFLSIIFCNVVLYYYNTFFNNEPYTIRYSIVHTGNWKNREVEKIIDGKFYKEIVVTEDIITGEVYMTWREFMIYDFKATVIAKTCEEILEVFTGKKIFSKVLSFIISLIFLQRNR